MMIRTLECFFCTTITSMASTNPESAEIGLGNDLLAAMARKYVWWQKPTQALVYPNRVIAQVMDIGDYDDVVAVARQYGDDRLRQVVRTAEAGQFNARSWTYWHYRLGIAKPGQVPPMPARRLA